jgi:hypothetical protein
MYCKYRSLKYITGLEYFILQRTHSEVWLSCGDHDFLGCRTRQCQYEKIDTDVAQTGETIERIRQFVVVNLKLYKEIHIMKFQK